MEATILSANEESPIKVVRMLPPDEARKVLVLGAATRAAAGDVFIERQEREGG